MPIDPADLTPNILQVGLGSAPVVLPSVDLRRVFVDLERFGFDSYATLPDGGASFGKADQTREFVVQSAQRTVTAAVSLSLPQILDEALDIFGVVEARLPASHLLWQATITSHQPVRGESARALLDRRLFPNSATAFDHLGQNQLGTGIRAILSGGQARLTVEPLVTRPDTLFVQYIVSTPGQVSVSDLRGVMEGVLRYHDRNVRSFVAGLLA